MKGILSTLTAPLRWIDERYHRMLASGAMARVAIYLPLFLLFAIIPSIMNARFVSGASSYFLDPYVMTVLTRILIFSIAAIGLNTIVGYTGQLNLGFVGFVAIGAYTTGVLMRDGAFGSGPLSFWIAAPLAVFHAALWGVLLGLPTLRLTGDYFAIVTFGFGELVALVARNWDSVTGGAQGLKDVPRVSVQFPWMAEPLVFLRDGTWPVWVVGLTFLSATCFAIWRLSRSRIGRAWFAMREDEPAAEACGINTSWYKSLCFAVGAGLGGLAGTIYPILNGGVYVTDFSMIISVYILVFVIVGGMGSITGSVIGTTIFVGLLEVLREVISRYNDTAPRMPIDPEIRLILYGAILILIVRVRPAGLLPQRVLPRLQLGR